MASILTFKRMRTQLMCMQSGFSALKTASSRHVDITNQNLPVSVTTTGRVKVDIVHGPPVKTIGWHYVIHCFAVTLDCGKRQSDSGARKCGGGGNNETYWKELHAAMALTNLAQAKESAAPGTTSCIIQKSSHIAEIKTVKVPAQPQH